MIAIVDYGVGNLFSLASSFKFIGAECTVASRPEELACAERIILPGVGAFADAMAKLSSSGLLSPLLAEAKNGKPLLGICLGMQLLLTESYEYGRHDGLGLIPGSVRPIADVITPGLSIPHIGWNALSFPRQHPLFKNSAEGDHVYFVHSYYAADCPDSVIAYTEYGAPLTAAVSRGNVMGVQFHPEKSGEAGLNILKAFLEYQA